MSEHNPKIEAERQLLLDAQAKGPGATLGAYLRLSGPGWLQSALTLGGGSLAGSLYLGVLGGFTLLWVQPLFMILGIVMLSAIGYVTLSTGKRPFQAINDHVNPVLGWGWALASLSANIVWSMPQFALANSVLEQNLMPGVYSSLGADGGKVAVSAAILVITVLITWAYGSGHWGIKFYEVLLKCMVASIVVCFALVVLALSRQGTLDWGAIFAGFVPDLGTIFRPAPALQDHLQAIGSETARAFWSGEIVQSQRDKIIAAAATAVGINMTFLFPYSLLRKGWTKEFRGLQRFDLSTGMFIPFVFATSCVVIAAASQFHARPVPGLVVNADGTLGGQATANSKEQKAYSDILKKRLKQAGVAGLDKMEAEALQAEIAGLPAEERLVAAMLIDRDANRLSEALAPATGGDAANWLFGLGVVGMTLSTITILMLISGFVLCEIFSLPQSGWAFRLCCLPAALGVLGPFVWGKAGFALAVPTSIFGFMLLPLAYLTFFFLMNQRKLLGSEMPTGGRRVVWNTLMGIAAGVAAYASMTEILNRTGAWGPWLLGGLLLLIGAGQVYRWMNPVAESAAKA